MRSSQRPEWSSTDATAILCPRFRNPAISSGGGSDALVGLDSLQKTFLFHDAPHPLLMAIEAASPEAPHIATKIRPLSMCCVSLRSTQPTIHHPHVRADALRCVE